MDNYLDHRWPKGPGVQPPPVPAFPAPRPSQKPKGRLRRWVIPITCVALCLALLAGICFWAVNGIAGMLAQMTPSLPDDPQPWNSRLVSSGSSWSPDDLPWGEPDPSVTLSGHPAGANLSGSQAYQNTLPSLVCVEAASASRFQGTSIGTGVIVTGDGYVVTNYHIIDESVQIQVRLLTDQTTLYNALVIGYDEAFDIAVLKFNPGDTQLVPAQLGDSDQLSIGDWVYAVGNPMGYLLGSMSVGIVSALDRELNQNDPNANGALGLIQVDNPLNPGNSGGALLNESGQVVGITCAKITGIERESGESIDEAVVLEGMGLAIPITDAIPFINHILATGESWRPAMGIQCIEAEADGRRGIQVREVTGAPAQEAGLKNGDLVVSANGRDTTTLMELRRVLYRAGAGEDVTFTVLRDGQELDITFALTDSLKQAQE